MCNTQSNAERIKEDVVPVAARWVWVRLCKYRTKTMKTRKNHFLCLRTECFHSIESSSFVVRHTHTATVACACLCVQNWTQRPVDPDPTDERIDVALFIRCNAHATVPLTGTHEMQLIVMLSYGVKELYETVEHIKINGNLVLWLVLFSSLLFFFYLLFCCNFFTSSLLFVTFFDFFLFTFEYKYRIDAQDFCIFRIVLLYERRGECVQSGEKEREHSRMLRNYPLWISIFVYFSLVVLFFFFFVSFIYREIGRSHDSLSLVRLVHTHYIGTYDIPVAVV